MIIKLMNRFIRRDQGLGGLNLSCLVYLVNGWIKKVGRSIGPLMELTIGN